MSAMENSLRRALDAGDAKDPAFRESIYAASERALERMLAQKGLNEDAAHQQRTRLAETINRVEDEFYERQTAAGAAEDGPAQHDPALSLDPAYMDAHAYATHPAEESGHHHAEEAEEPEFTVVYDEDEPDENGLRTARPAAIAIGLADGATVSEPVKPSPRSTGSGSGRAATLRSNAQFRRFLMLALVVALLVAVGAYMVYAFAGSEREEASGAAGAGWISLFDGERLEALAAANGGRIEGVGESVTGVRPGVRFTPAGEASAIDVAVGAGVVSALAGRRALVEVAAGSPDGENRSFAVECRIGEASVCGRQVFNTPRRTDNFVFDMNVPTEGASGELAITPAVSPTGKADLLIYSVRMKDGGAPNA